MLVINELNKRDYDIDIWNNGDAIKLYDHGNYYNLQKSDISYLKFFDEYDNFTSAYYRLINSLNWYVDPDDELDTDGQEFIIQELEDIMTDYQKENF